MFRQSLRQASTVALGLGVLLSAQACGSSNDSTGPSLGPGFSLAVGSTALAVPAGSTVSTSITASRVGGLMAPITYVVSGAPDGLTAVVSTTDVPDRVTLAVSASPALAPATFPIRVTASALGAQAQETTVTVTVSRAANAIDIVQLAVGAHACAVSLTDNAYCWGYNGNGQLGNGGTALVTAMPVAVAGGLPFEKVVVSQVEDDTCALTIAGIAYCWGRNDRGEIGDGTSTGRLVPTRVSTDLAFRDLSVGAGHACAVATTGAAYCWGFSPNGAFGDGSVGLRLTPALSAPGLTFKRIVTGSDYTCGLTLTGAAYCWGLGVQGQLGNGSTAISSVPVPVSGGLTFQSLVAGGFAACGLTDDGKAYCWGHNFYGTLGIGTSATEGGQSRSLTPVAVLGGLRFESLSAGFETICGVATGGVGYCWGYNASGQVGDGSTEHRSLPVRVAGDLLFRTIAAGTGASCGIATTGAVYCWGDNANGTLGDGTTTARLTPTLVRWQ